MFTLLLAEVTWNDMCHDIPWAVKDVEYIPLSISSIGYLETLWISESGSACWLHRTWWIQETNAFVLKDNTIVWGMTDTLIEYTIWYDYIYAILQFIYSQYDTSSTRLNLISTFFKFDSLPLPGSWCYACFFPIFLWGALRWRYHDPGSGKRLEPW